MTENQTQPNERNVPISEIGRQKKNTVLIIEDDKFLRDLISQKMTQEGYEVLEAVDGEEGFKMLSERKPTIVLLDLIIPGLDGFGVLKKVKESAELSSLPIIVLSNLGSKEDLEQAKALGAKTFLVKAHYTPAEVIEEIKKVIKDSYL